MIVRAQRVDDCDAQGPAGDSILAIGTGRFYRRRQQRPSHEKHTDIPLERLQYDLFCYFKFRQPIRRLRMMFGTNRDTRCIDGRIFS